MAIMEAESKAVIKLEVTDAKSKKAAQKALVYIDGFSSYTLDYEKSMLVVIGNIDPIAILNKLKKFVSAVLVSYGPVNGGGNVDQQLQPPFDGPPNYGAGPSGSDYPYQYF